MSVILITPQMRPGSRPLLPAGTHAGEPMTAALTIVRRLVIHRTKCRLTVPCHQTWSLSVLVGRRLSLSLSTTLDNLAKTLSLIARSCVRNHSSVDISVCPFAILATAVHAPKPWILIAAAAESTAKVSATRVRLSTLYASRSARRLETVDVTAVASTAVLARRRPS